MSHLISFNVMSFDRSREVLSCTFTLPESSFGESFMDCRLLSGCQGTVKIISNY